MIAAAAAAVEAKQETKNGKPTTCGLAETGRAVHASNSSGLQMGPRQGPLALLIASDHLSSRQRDLCLRI